MTPHKYLSAPQPVPTDSHAQGTRYFCGICGGTSEPCTHQRELAHAQGTTPATQPKVKATYVGAPKIFALEQCCRQIDEAFGDYGCYLVGSALDRPDWRDVDVRFIMEDKKFAELFPDAGDYWEQDQRWLLLTVAISDWFSKITGLPIDFQIQSQTHANARHKGKRSALGLKIDWKSAAQPSAPSVSETPQKENQ